MSIQLISYLALAFSLLSLTLSVLFFARFRKYEKRQAELLSGEEVNNLEEIALKQKKQLGTHHKNLKEIGKILEELVEKNKLGIQRVGLVRYNPFGDTGGDMSFVLALLDGKNNGIVLSSLHSREGTRIYAKPIAGGLSKHSLTEEEKKAIQQAGEG